MVLGFPGCAMKVVGQQGMPLLSLTTSVWTSFVTKHKNGNVALIVLLRVPSLSEMGPAYSTPVVRNGLDGCTRGCGSSPVSCCFACG